ncbi:MAG: archaeosine biosynthesis radical SAM protein RaSEA [Candidatus Heimdallarchaeota archaeon]|nr:archaeosine biosynthesis radical SAM protein RaSEA [Candidatus Heimdallarchaeota archaeon]MCK4769664.1 archaeosine biosynthesis radical SAM protein RaSEA [Candidatus Heimdallarchaeota archaeon]
MKINKSLAEEILKIRESTLPSRKHSRKVTHWKENHRLRSGKGEALVFILPTKGCSWALAKSGGCSICGYIYDNPQESDFDMMVSSIKNTLRRTIEEGKFSIKLFTSGSFLDENELPIEIQTSIIQEIAKYEQIEEVVLESRPEYVTNKILQNLTKNIEMSKIEIAIGLESANNRILKNSINKGFFWEDFEKSAKRVLNSGAKVKPYLLFKPPFVSEYDSIKDILQSVSKVVSIDIDTVSINAMSIHRGTFLSEVYEQKLYRSPWLWSLLTICKEIKQKYPEIRIICDIVAGGKERGAHNCGKCDEEIIRKIKKFTLTQNVDELEEEEECKCKEEWKSILISEKINISDYLHVPYLE